MIIKDLKIKDLKIKDLKIKDLKSLIDAISNNIKKSFFVITAIFLISWFIYKNETEIKSNAAAQEELNASINVLKSMISEKISIIAVSPIFRDYLNSGYLTRQDLKTSFSAEISSLHIKSIIGINISNDKGQAIFNRGKISPYFVKLNLCYSDSILNKQVGNCNFYMSIYFDKNKVIDSIREINERINKCTNCNKTEFFGSKDFGNFNVKDSSSLKVNLTTKKDNNFFVFIFLFFILIPILIYTWIFFKTKFMFNKYLGKPLEETSTALKNGELPTSCIYIEEIKYLIQQIKFYKAEEHKNNELKKVAALSSQIRHDIRSPLTLLNIILAGFHDSTEITDNKRNAMRNAIDRITGILNLSIEENKFVNSNKLPADSTNEEICLLASLIESMISEKQLEYKKHCFSLNSDISEKVLTSFVSVNVSKLKTILSNIINNSVEAIDLTKGKILVSLDTDMNNIYLKIIDNGSGMSDEIKKKAVEGQSFKKNGSGLGLSNSIHYIESIGGKFTLNTEQNKGTEIIITLPKSSAPSWFVSQITLLKNSTLAILDDDESIHDAWKEKLVSIKQELNCVFFKRSEDFKSWYKEFKSPVQIFSDYELVCEDTTGLDLIENISQFKNSTLVTSHYENSNIISRCEKQGIGLLPKNLLAYIPIYLK